MSQEITPGSVVQLRSGGPPMTVDNIEGHFANCVWFPPDSRQTLFQIPFGNREHAAELEDKLRKSGDVVVPFEVQVHALGGHSCRPERDRFRLAALNLVPPAGAAPELGHATADDE